LLPDPVVVEEMQIGLDPGASDGLDLFTEEQAVVAGAVEKRRQEFAAVCWCARRALARLGYPPGPILPGDRGQPIWPTGIVGSMTHCLGYAAAAVARCAETASIGIDAEPNQPLPDGVLEEISLPQEQVWIDELAPDRRGVCWDRLLFSAKESVYKTWFPLARQWLGFEDVRISVDPSGESFSARLLMPAPVVDGMPLTELTGRWAVAEGLVVTSIVMLRDGRGAPL